MTSIAELADAALDALAIIRAIDAEDGEVEALLIGQCNQAEVIECLARLVVNRLPIMDPEIMDESIRYLTGWKAEAE